MTAVEKLRELIGTGPTEDRYVTLKAAEWGEVVAALGVPADLAKEVGLGNLAGNPFPATERMPAPSPKKLRSLEYSITAENAAKVLAAVKEETPSVDPPRPRSPKPAPGRPPEGG